MLARNSCLLLGMGVVLCHQAVGQVMQRVSITTSGMQADFHSTYPSVSADGRFVAFSSGATNLVSGDTNGLEDVFVRDRQTGITERVSVASDGTEANGSSTLGVGAAMSADGRYVTFWSAADNLVPGDTNGVVDVFVRDRQSGTTELVSVDSNGTHGNNESNTSVISADGRYVAFNSHSTNLVAGDANGFTDIFVRDLQNGTTERVSVDSAGVEGNHASVAPRISADGRYVAFRSVASNLVGGDTNGFDDAFVHDRQTGGTELVSVSSGGVQGNDDSFGVGAISADGRYVEFEGMASNLVSGDTNNQPDIFIRDRQSGTTERVDVDSGGGQASVGAYASSMSADARFVVFMSDSTNLVMGDTNAYVDVFLRDRQNATTTRVSVGPNGIQGNSGSYFPAMSADGRYAAFSSSASNIVLGDTNDYSDVFLMDYLGAPDFASLCDPGSGGVIPCPCANAPSGPGRGCDNSSATGGAVLSASGGTFLSCDSLVFTTAGQRDQPVLSIVAQGTALVPNGAIYGQGVRCAGGSLKRLYVKQSVGGSITAPQGDPPVSACSAAKGDVIQAGQSRFYLVYYRDPNVLGGCSAGSTFNATQTGRVTWWP